MTIKDKSFWPTKTGLEQVGNMNLPQLVETLIRFSTFNNDDSRDCDYALVKDFKTRTKELLGDL